MEREGIAGEPGSAKTPALKHVLKPIYVEQERLFADYKAARERYEQESEEYAKPKTADPDTPAPAKPVAPPPPRHLFVSDATTEALAAALERNPKGLLVYRDELAAWVRNTDMYRAKGADTQFFLSAWSSEFVKVDRRQRQDDPISVPHPFIAVLGGTQPDILPDVDVRHGKQDGFLTRLLFAYPPSGGIVLADYFTAQVRFICPCLARTAEDRKVEDLVARMRRQASHLVFCLTSPYPWRGSRGSPLP